LAFDFEKDKLPLFGAYFMKRLKAEDELREMKCPTCSGTGFPEVKQPKPGRKIYPAPCKECAGKGRLAME
jgi:DnaJ-class molecular chaperone